jgi:hypothetical protein
MLQRESREEHRKIYPDFSRIAMEEGFDELSRLWKNIAVVEGLHYRIFMEAREQFINGTLYHKDKPTVWRCLNCGYIYTAEEPYAQCPGLQEGKRLGNGLCKSKKHFLREVQTKVAAVGGLCYDSSNRNEGACQCNILFWIWNGISRGPAPHRP